MLNSTRSKTEPQIYFQVYGSDQLWRVNDQEYYRKGLSKLKENLQFEETEDGDVTFLLKPENARWEIKTPNVATCGFEATKTYLRNMVGPILDDHDLTWYKRHPLMKSAGLDMAYTLSLLQALIKPYHCGISAVYYPPEMSMSDDYKAWTKVLGTNPLAPMSNENYIELMGEGNPEYIKELQEECQKYRFNFSTKFDGAAIIFQSGDNKTRWAQGGGHASYLGTRAARPTAMVAIKIDRLENIQYHQEPPILDYEEKDIVKTLDPASSLTDNNQSIRSVLYTPTVYNHHNHRYGDPDFFAFRGEKITPKADEKKKSSPLEASKPKKIARNQIHFFNQFLSELTICSKYEDLSSEDQEVQPRFVQDLVDGFLDLKQLPNQIVQAWTKGTITFSDVLDLPTEDSVSELVQDQVLDLISFVEYFLVDASIAEIFVFLKTVAQTSSFQKQSFRFMMALSLHALMEDYETLFDWVTFEEKALDFVLKKNNWYLAPK